MFGVDAGMDASDDHGLHRRHDPQSAEKRLLTKASLRWVRVSITLIWMFASILARLRRRCDGEFLAAAAAERFSLEAQ
jgi:hypothetical protein